VQRERKWSGSSARDNVHHRLVVQHSIRLGVEVHRREAVGAGNEDGVANDRDPRARRVVRHVHVCNAQQRLAPSLMIRVTLASRTPRRDPAHGDARRHLASRHNSAGQWEATHH
jgi:hypothetical protein